MGRWLYIVSEDMEGDGHDLFEGKYPGLLMEGVSRHQETSCRTAGNRPSKSRYLPHTILGRSLPVTADIMRYNIS
jgi:hypothetical protein